MEMKEKYKRDGRAPIPKKEVTSRIMSANKGRNTKPEIKLRKSLWKLNIRYRLLNNDIIGKPDVVIRKYKLAIFVDGDFWHGYNWNEKKLKIKSNREYWIAKIEKNIKRDKMNSNALKEMNWSVMRFWEHQVREDSDGCALQVLKEINRLRASRDQG